MKGTIAVLAMLALVVLAGCNTFGGASTTRPSFDVDEPTTTTDAPGESRLVVSYDPVRNITPSPSDVVESHETQLDGESYVVEYTHVRTYANGTTITAEDWTSTFAPDRSTYAQNRESTYGNESVTRKLYANGTHVWAWTRKGDSGDPSVRLLARPDGTPVPPLEAAATGQTDEVLTGLRTTEVRTVRKLDGVPSGVDTSVFRIVSTVREETNPYGDETLNGSVSLVVTGDGRILEYHHETTFVEDGETIHAETRIEYGGIGTATVDRPRWVPANNSTATLVGQ